MKTIHYTCGIKPSDITPQALFKRRREFIKQSLGAAAMLALPTAAAAKLGDKARKSHYSVTEEPTSRKYVTGYNNFAEFGPSKTDPAELAGKMRTRPWTITLDGLVQKPVTLGIEDVLKLAPIEERIYPLRCVETWSMVIPWLGFPLDVLLKQVEPLGSAKYIEILSDLQPDVMPDVKYGLLDWPYKEGLRLDEARHPLTLLALGVFDDILPNQCGAPLRLVLPWKYGYKSAKSIVSIRFVEEQPQTLWMEAAPRSYGFYANVNPKVSKTRWSQARERRIGDFFKRDTLMFNGFAEEVASLYTGMDLRRNF